MPRKHRELAIPYATIHVSWNLLSDVLAVGPGTTIEREIAMAKSQTENLSKSQRGRKAVRGLSPGAKANSKVRSSKQKRAQPRAASRSQSEVKSSPVSSRSRTARSATEAVSGSRSEAASWRGVERPHNWFESIETMITSREGREILADALRAVADVLSRHRQNEEREDGMGTNPGAEWPVGAEKTR
jgi:hypothetical protein